jgi:hypothetical protein
MLDRPEIANGILPEAIPRNRGAGLVLVPVIRISPMARHITQSGPSSRKAPGSELIA